MPFLATEGILVDPALQKVILPMARHEEELMENLVEKLKDGFEEDLTEGPTESGSELEGEIGKELTVEEECKEVLQGNRVGEEWSVLSFAQRSRQSTKSYLRSRTSVGSRPCRTSTNPTPSNTLPSLTVLCHQIPSNGMSTSQNSTSILSYDIA